MQSSAAELSPTRPRERIETIDVLRGFALFGVLLVNIWDYGAELRPGELEFLERWPELANVAAVRAMEFCAEGKFFRLFSFLFGLGLAMQMERAESRGIAFVPLYSRRLAVLLLIGLAHSLIWYGDILHYYAALGFLVLLVRHWPSPAVLTLAAFCLLAYPLDTIINRGVTELDRAERQTKHSVLEGEVRQETAHVEQRVERAQVLSQGSFSEITAYNAQRFVREHASWGDYSSLLGEEYVMFLLGLLVGRRRIFHDIPGHTGSIRRIMSWGLVIGLAGMGASLLPAWLLPDSDLQQILAPLPWAIGAPALTLFYATGLTLVAQQPGWKRRLSPLAAVGRLALSNYLLQTVACVLIFYGYGMALSQRISPAMGIVLTFVIFAVQARLSVWWLGRFRFGPAEWLWRTLTYGRAQPMLVTRAAVGREL